MSKTRWSRILTPAMHFDMIFEYRTEEKTRKNKINRQKEKKDMLLLLVILVFINFSSFSLKIDSQC